MKTVFIDGAAGTTGLRIHQRLAQDPDIALVTLADTERKSLSARLAAIEQADVSILCLPDIASREIVAHLPAHARVCDTSTAHRTAPGWVYGFPELVGSEQVAQAQRVAVPGCHASGFLALVVPLRQIGALQADTSLTCYSLTGYSGGGNPMIASYQAGERSSALEAPRLYGLGLSHKHLPEMKKQAALTQTPLFCPVVSDYYSGLLVSIPLPMAQLAPEWRSGEGITQALMQYYAQSPLIHVHPYGHAPEDGMLSANAFSGRDDMELFVLGNNEQLLLCARFDNLGKGASGAAIQCLNLMLGRDPLTGLHKENA